MTIRIISKCLLASYLLLIAGAGTCLENKTELLLNPSRCVALHQGQVCYQTVKLHWKTPLVGNYCVYQSPKDQSPSTQDQPLNCWRNAAEGVFIFEFAGDSSTSIGLINGDDNTLVLEAIFEVAWVYKSNSRRKSHWRIF